MILETQRTVGVFIKIHSFLGIFYMSVQPPMNRLDLGIPGITGVITMTVHTGLCHNVFYIFGNSKCIPDIIGLGSRRFIFFGMKELNNDKSSQEEEEYFF